MLSQRESECDEVSRECNEVNWLYSVPGLPFIDFISVRFFGSSGYCLLHTIQWDIGSLTFDSVFANLIRVN